MIVLPRSFCFDISIVKFPDTYEQTCYRYPGRSKKHSLPASNRQVPTLSLNFNRHEDVDDITRQLETAVRKMSRGSPNLTSPNRLCGTSPCRFSTVGPTVFTDLTLNGGNRIGLSGLARGYEQYRESLMDLRPQSMEFGEASSDDLSSEWDSCSESESSPIPGIPFIEFPPTLIPRRPQREAGSDGTPLLPDETASGQSGDRSSEEEVGTNASRSSLKRVSGLGRLA